MDRVEAEGRQDSIAGGRESDAAIGEARKEKHSSEEFESDLR